MHKSILNPITLMLLLSIGSGSGYPVLEYYVTDQVGVLTTYDIMDIEDICIEAYNSKGVEMAVLIVNTTQPDGIDLFAVKTFEVSGIGQKGEDNGLLLLISVSEDLWRIEIGYGLEGVLPDVLVNQIAEDHLIPFLADGDYYNGILYTLAFLGEQILDNYEGEPPDDDDGPWYPIFFLPLTCWQLSLTIFIMIVVLSLTGGRIFLWVGGSFKRGGGGFGGGRSGGGGAKGRY